MTDAALLAIRDAELDIAKFQRDLYQRRLTTLENAFHTIGKSKVLKRLIAIADDTTCIELMDNEWTNLCLEITQ